MLDHGGLLDYRMLWKEKVAPDFRHPQGRRGPPHAQLKTILRPGEPRTAIHCDVAFLTLRGSRHEAP